MCVSHRRVIDGMLLETKLNERKLSVAIEFDTNTYRRHIVVMNKYTI